MFGYDWTRAHALLNDLPAALLVTAVLFDLLAFATRRESLRQAGFWMMVAGAVGGALAVISGLQAEEYIAHGEAVHRVMETHETLGLISLGVFGTLALWRIIRERRMGGRERSLALILSLGGVAVLVATGWYGGRLVFDHAAGIPSQVLQQELGSRDVDDHHHGEEAAGASSMDSVIRAEPAGRMDSAGVPAKAHVDPPGTPPHTH